MSIRPRAAAPDPARGADYSRRRWSESPVPRVPRPAVRVQGSIPVDPALDAMYWSSDYYEISGGDGTSYPIISLPQDIPVSEYQLGDITGLPVIQIVRADAYTDLRPPAGWSQHFQVTQSLGSEQSLTVWSVDAYAGEPLYGTANGSVPVDRFGTVYRLNCIMLVGATPGTWLSELGVASQDVLNWTDPGGVYRLQLAGTEVPYNKTWTPGVGTCPVEGCERFGPNYGAILGNVGGHITEFDNGWLDVDRTNALMRDVPTPTQTYTHEQPNYGENTIPVNIRWQGAA